MKKRYLIFCMILVLLFALLIPFPSGVLDDGGTKIFSALTYKIVIWNKMIPITNENGEMERIETYHKTSVFWLPDHFKSIEELWEIECKEN